MHVAGFVGQAHVHDVFHGDGIFGCDRIVTADHAHAFCLLHCLAPVLLVEIVPAFIRYTHSRSLQKSVVIMAPDE